MSCDWLCRLSFDATHLLQLSLGNIVLLEAPITIGELSTYDANNVLTPFVAGPQPIEEVDETQRIAIGGPFMYTPVYSMKLNSSNEAKAVSDGNFRPASHTHFSLYRSTSLGVDD